MGHISSNTLFRALTATSNLGQAAGDYENKPCTKVVKGTIGVLTLGIGYGIFWLCEHFGNASPKIKEFRAAAVELHHQLGSASRELGVGAYVTITTREGATLTFSELRDGVQIEDESTGEGYRFLRGKTLHGIQEQLAKDFLDHPRDYEEFRVKADPDPIPVVLGHRTMDGLIGKGIAYTAMTKNPSDVELLIREEEKAIVKPPFAEIDIHRVKIREFNLCPLFRPKRGASLTKDYSLRKAPSMRTMKLDMSNVILEKHQYGELYDFMVIHPELINLTLNLSLIRYSESASMAVNKGIKLPLFAIKNLHKLEDLKLQLNNMSNLRERRSSIFRSTIAALKNLNKIKTLKIEMEDWGEIKDAMSGRTDNEFIEILDSVSKLKTLRHFSINIAGNYGLSSRGLDNIIDKFKEFEQLNSLELTIGSNEEKHLFGLCDTLKSLKNLKIIKLQADTHRWNSTSQEKFRKALDEIRARGATVMLL
ncbi:leucine-rich repeat domain-containing protein [Pandoraea sputorum]|uniref:Uncharacterized protein n=1 Tax=Pandoraea sputorum TaxID=93222 RepID=A0A5E5BLF6_9BURK|nr:hypothetical protein [Pandoraea sputorum]VVE85952.1 hypothetical protein PSP31121_05586 [Pandoraea sputorum]